MAVNAGHSHCLLELELLQTKQHLTPKWIFSAAYAGDMRSFAKISSAIDCFN